MERAAFFDAWTRRLVFDIDGVTVPFIGHDNLLFNKLDAVDVAKFRIFSVSPSRVRSESAQKLDNLARH